LDLPWLSGQPTGGIDGIHLSLKLPLAVTEPSDVASPGVNLPLSRLVPMQMKRRGVEMRIVLEGDSNPAHIDPPLLKAVARARRWSDDLLSGRVRSVDELAKRERLDSRSVRRLIPLGFLSPGIVEAIAEGRQPVELTSGKAHTANRSSIALERPGAGRRHEVDWRR
jgi:hypothetical protein